ncbi:hypothetical protein M422DRAFT_266402 [Sphaerobolus stellatus SS14]|uniref:Uncharacterized protein n=1 Tax=Sphaerobolus stellatus (strain SS14) TaxID=990650 RepID=A0A0C9UBD7_SPHS4|nr:hypothetical protein M422DRAFT_266402 [Sphaerobolus stellatus SS14]
MEHENAVVAGVGGGDHAVSHQQATQVLFVEGTDAGKMVANRRESEVADTLPTVLAAPSPAPIAPVSPAEPLMIDGSYDKVEGRQGVSLAEYEKQLKSNHLKFKKALADEYMSHFKAYNLTQLLPPNPSHSQQKATDNHVLKKIDNLFRDHHTKSGDPPDMMELLFRQVRKSTARDCWARSDPTYKVKEAERMVINKWTPDMDHQVSSPIQMQARRELWDELSEEDKDKWEAEALRQKDIVPTREMLLGAMAELWALVGDAWVARNRWYLDIRTAGIGGDGLPHYFSLGSSLPESEAYDISLRKGVADFSKVKPADVKDVPTWKSKVTMPKLGGRPLIKLSGMVLTDDKGEIVTAEDTLREAIINYMNMTFALCLVAREAGKGHPSKLNWNGMWLAGMNNYVDPQCLPPAPFVFDNPERLRDKDLQPFGMWLLKAELGQLAPENCFRWKGQQAGVARGVRWKGGAGGQTKAVEPKATNEGTDTNTGSMVIVSIEGLGTMKAAAETANDEVGRMSSGSDRDSKRALEDEESSQPGKKPWKTLTTSRAGDSAIPQILVPEVSGNSERSVEKKPVTGHKFGAKKGGGSDTDGHDASEALVVRGAPSETFQWRYGDDFKCHHDLLDWDESVVEGPMGSPVPLSARFIDGMEVRAPLVLGAQLDISAPEDTLTDGVAKIIEDTLLTSKPLPKPSIVQMLGQKNCASIFEVGGNLALFPGLRAVEFLQQYVHSVDKDPKRRSQVNLLLERYHTTLAQEAWRRWAIMSFAQSRLDADEWFGLQWRNGSRPKIIDDIVHLAARRVRPIQADEFGVPYIDVTWRQEDIRLGMESWSKEMPKTEFKRGSVLELFLWVYGLYMVAGPGGEHGTTWCKHAIEETVGWLLDLIKERELGILVQREGVLSDNPTSAGNRKKPRKTKKVEPAALLMDASVSSAVVPTKGVIHTTRKPRSKADPTNSPIHASTHLKGIS